MNRTVRIQLIVTDEQSLILAETLRQFTHVFNDVCTYGWQNNEKNGVKLHHATYYTAREAYPQLNANVLIQARMKATEALKSAFTWKAKHEDLYPKKVANALKHGRPVPRFRPVKCPQSLSCPIRYNERTYGLSWEQQTVNLSTIQGRIILPFITPCYSAQYVGYPIAAADLCYRKGKYWLHVMVDVPEPNIEKSDTVVGVDLGLNHPAVTSERQFLGSSHWKEVDRRTFRLRRKLQSKGSKSAKRHLKKLSKRQARFHRDCDHVLSKRLTQSTPHGATIVFENLTNIRESSKMGRGKDNKNVDNKRKLHSWTFAQLYDFTAYKAQEKGIRVERIDPRHTSQTCSCCGYQHRSNRRSQSFFKCRQCEYRLNADLNAAKNIRDKHLASLATLGISLSGGCQSMHLSSQPSLEG
jgi:putative transposase